MRSGNRDNFAVLKLCVARAAHETLAVESGTGESLSFFYVFRGIDGIYFFKHKSTMAANNFAHACYSS